MIHSLPLRPRRAVRMTAALAGLLAAAALALALVPGSASASFSQCGRGNFCAWDGYNGGGAFLYFHDWNDSTWHNDRPADGSGGLSSDRANSVRNNGYAGAYQDVIFWTDINYRGMGYCNDVGERYVDLGSWNNRISSHQWVHNCAEGVVYRRTRAGSARTTLKRTAAISRGLELPRH